MASASKKTKPASVESATDARALAATVRKARAEADRLKKRTQAAKALLKAAKKAFKEAKKLAKRAQATVDAAAKSLKSALKTAPVAKSSTPSVSKEKSAAKTRKPKRRQAKRIGVVVRKQTVPRSAKAVTPAVGAPARDSIPAPRRRVRKPSLKPGTPPVIVDAGLDTVANRDE